ncbi:kinase-like domain-containing protein [Rhizophagus clarus]|uniref:Kinase-like domain-containing protein n=1 Tax=Rhizophagus clarus TaxID=94130 RepID=A0A8H3L9T8_9GLOM|nr:kinase-like domain-containing protein [Rhizophagus clarus]
MAEIRKTSVNGFIEMRILNNFYQVESKRDELIVFSEKLGPEFCENPHQETSRPLSFFISKCSSIYSSSLSINTSKSYISIEQELDIGFEKHQN